MSPAANPRPAMTPWDRRALGYALLFSVPPGLGVTGFTTNATGGGLYTTPALVAGAATWAIIFGLVMTAVAFGPDEEDGEGATGAEEA